jgi:hypothetical protein
MITQRQSTAGTKLDIGAGLSGLLGSGGNTSTTLANYIGMGRNTGANGVSSNMTNGAATNMYNGSPLTRPEMSMGNISTVTNGATVMNRAFDNNVDMPQRYRNNDIRRFGGGNRFAINNGTYRYGNNDGYLYNDFGWGLPSDVIANYPYPAPGQISVDGRRAGYGRGYGGRYGRRYGRGYGRGYIPGSALGYESIADYPYPYDQAHGDGLLSGNAAGYGRGYGWGYAPGPGSDFGYGIGYGSPNGIGYAPTYGLGYGPGYGVGDSPGTAFIFGNVHPEYNPIYGTPDFAGRSGFQPYPGYPYGRPVRTNRTLYAYGNPGYTYQFVPPECTPYSSCRQLYGDTNDCRSCVINQWGSGNCADKICGTHVY